MCYRDIRNCRYYYPRTNRISKRVLNRHSPSQSLREEVKRSVMNGSESRLAAMNYIDADCTPGPVPVVRIVTPPKNGEFRMEEVSIPLNRPAGNARAKCNGTPVQAVGVYYKAKAEYTGDDAMVIDVDFKHGYIKRFVYAISVR
ncbi:MAG TPA: hypothetical protein VFB45_23065 [Pseudolabrys sp.]|nr:hypothetical protein [Pseudolabrys sp.]